MATIATIAAVMLNPVSAVVAFAAAYIGLKFHSTSGRALIIAALAIAYIAFSHEAMEATYMDSTGIALNHFATAVWFAIATLSILLWQRRSKRARDPNESDAVRRDRSNNIVSAYDHFHRKP